MERVRILAIGAFSVPYIRNNWGYVLKDQLGDNVTCVNANLFLARDGHLLESYLFRLLCSGDFDYCFFYHDWIFNDFSDDFFDQVRTCGVPVLSFYPDDEPEVWYARNCIYDHHYDLIATHSLHGYNRRTTTEPDKHVCYLPWGFNPSVYARQEHSDFDYDLVFIGKNKVHDNEEGLYREDGRNRHETLISLAEAAQARGWTFKLFGFGWEKHPVLKDFAGGIPSDEEIVSIYNRTRIVFNPAWSSDDECPQPQTKLRHFEVPGCGAFQLTNANPELAQLFEPGREVAFFSDQQHLVEQVDYYLTHEDQRRAVAEAGWMRAQKEHTLQHRLVALLDYAQQVLPRREKVESRRKLDIMRVVVDSEAELRTLYRDLLERPEEFCGCDAMHFLGGDFRVEDVCYGGVEALLRRDDLALVGVRSFFDYRGLAANELQPTREEIAGDFIPELFTWDDFRQCNQQAVETSFVQIRGQRKGACLMNYLVRPEAAPALLKAFIDNSIDALEALLPYHSGVIVNEVSLDRCLLSEPLRQALSVPDYIHHLKAAASSAERSGKRIVLYGAKGLMAERSLDWLFSVAGESLAGIVDNGLVGSRIRKVEIMGHGALEELRPDMIFIAAAFSGPAIMKDLKPWRGRAELLPLYDLNHSAWSHFQI